jgi:hypothetical protein
MGQILDREMDLSLPHRVEIEAHRRLAAARPPQTHVLPRESDEIAAGIETRCR